MATNPRFPNAQEGIAVGLPAPSHAYYNFFRTLNDAVNNGTISVDAANTLITALSARVDALEGRGTAEDLLGALYGTNGIAVFGDIASGVEIRGPDLTNLRQSIPPGRDGEDGADSYIPGPKGDKGDPGRDGSGTTIIVNEEHYEDSWPIPGPAGPAGSGSGGISSGTSFPGSPSDNDLYYRTDLDLLCFYSSSGTRWMTVNEYTLSGSTSSLLPHSTTQTWPTRYPVPTDYGIYLTRFSVRMYVLTTNSGTQYWTCNLYQYTTAEAQIGGSLGSGSTISAAADRYLAYDIAVNTAVDATAAIIAPVFTKVSTVGNLYPTYSLRYRKIIT